jgi:hypothetical protein
LIHWNDYVTFCKILAIRSHWNLCYLDCSHGNDRLPSAQG